MIGRNSFQRRKADAVRSLETIMGIYAGETPSAGSKATSVLPHEPDTQAGGMT